MPSKPYPHPEERPEGASGRTQGADPANHGFRAQPLRSDRGFSHLTPPKDAGFGLRSTACDDQPRRRVSLVPAKKPTDCLFLPGGIEGGMVRPSVIGGLGFRRRQERMGLGAVPAAARCHASRPLAQTPSAVKRAALAVSGRAWREFASNCERTPTTGGDLGRCCGSEVLRERASPHWRGRAPCFELVVERRINLKP